MRIANDLHYMPNPTFYSARFFPKERFGVKNVGGAERGEEVGGVVAREFMMSTCWRFLRLVETIV